MNFFVSKLNASESCNLANTLGNKQARKKGNLNEVFSNIIISL